MGIRKKIIDLDKMYKEQPRDKVFIAFAKKTG
jgi:hypothetical protein